MKIDLLQRYVEGNVTPEEVRTVVEWLDADEAHVREYMTLHKLYDISLWNKGTPTRTAQRRRPALQRIALECAMIAAACIAVFVYVHSPLRPSPAPPPTAFHTLFVPAGQRAELTLPDGTRVWLNAQSRLVYPALFEDGNREIRLDGEGYFEVAPDERQPFTVKTGEIDVEVLGTEFNVVAYASRAMTEVSLLKGSVALKPAGSERIYRMKPDECVRWTGGAFFSSAIKNYDYFKWKEGLLCFDEATVGSIMEKLELYYDVKIDVQKQDLSAYCYTGKFRIRDGVEQVLKVLQLEHRFSYIKDSERNIITIK
ncbi:MAG: FecR family protein [Tannerella sp.]|jgi:ferric-dicitrate binding protein FerR (iron transport regulator)|nr:FecR family protein [Tannerella sp.]